MAKVRISLDYSGVSDGNRVRIGLLEPVRFRSS